MKLTDYLLYSILRVIIEFAKIMADKGLFISNPVEIERIGDEVESEIKKAQNEIVRINKSIYGD